MITAKEAALQSVNANHGDLKVLTDSIDRYINTASKSGKRSVSVQTSVDRDVIDAAVRIVEQAGYVVTVHANNYPSGRMVPGEAYGHKYSINVVWGL